MRVIDFHSHILPGIDDGSRDTDMSWKMLEMAAEQGVRIMAATPHFYADRSSLNRFLEQRDAAVNQIQVMAESFGITILSGAETALFPGMGCSAGVKKLTISGTSLLLLEMPARRWSVEDMKEVEDLIRNGIQPIVAHIERACQYQRNKRRVEELLALPVYAQVNAQTLLDWRSRPLALRLFRKGKARLLGSDCHNMTNRPPNLGAGRAIIKKRLGEECLRQIDELGMELLGIIP